MAHLNRIIHETGCKLIISSAWRYIIHGGDMTLKGFSYLLRTHGLLSSAEVIDVTRRDRHSTEPRANQILDWIVDAKKGYSSRPIAWAILDDDDYGFNACPSCSGRFVRTNGKSGLNHVSAQQVIDVLIEETAYLNSPKEEPANDQ